MKAIKTQHPQKMPIVHWAIPAICLLFLAIAGFPQSAPPVSIIKVTGEKQPIYIPAPFEKPIAEFESMAEILIREFYEGLEVLYRENAISRSVKPDIEASIIDEDGVPAIRAFYSYAVLDVLQYETDDFSLGEYEVQHSMALYATLTLMANGISKHLDKYITPDISITFNIMGSADAVPIRSVIAYDGKWGNPIIMNAALETGSRQMNVSVARGISDNETLAFMRSFAVRNYIETRIPSVRRSRNTFNHKAVVSPYIGGEHRRVTIEMIIHNVFGNMQTD